MEHVFGFPVGIFKPFTSEQVLKIREELSEYCTQESGKSILTTEHWNANCLTSAPDGWGKDDVVGKKHPYQEDTLLVRTVEKTFREYLDANGLGELNPVMYKCGKSGCQECPRDCWINVYRDGHFQETHWHHGEKTGCVFGFVYFAKYDRDTDGRFTFVSPAPDLQVPGMCACPAFQREYQPEVTEGAIMFFPAFMLHRVTTQLQGERITLAGNFFCQPTVDA